MTKSNMLVFLAALIAATAVVFGIAAVMSLIFPGPSGEWARASVFFSAVVNLPIGLLTLAIGYLAKSATPRLRRLCIGLALTSLALPFVAEAVWRTRH